MAQGTALCQHVTRTTEVKNGEGVMSLPGERIRGREERTS